MSVPEAYIIAGPNGSGKSTLIRRLPALGIAIPEDYINPDDIARHLREQEPGTPAEALGRKAFQEGRRLRQVYREQGISFALETVFSHPSGLVDMQRLKEDGYRITLAVVTTSDPEINVRRVAQRVKTGGHDVEEAKIRERYQRFMVFLPRMVEMADRVFVFDSSEETRLCYQREDYPMESNVPDYLQGTLLGPLEERARCRLNLAGMIMPEQNILLPDEDAGNYEGGIWTGTPHYILQEIVSGQYVRHDLLLLSETPPSSGKVRIIYKEGYGKLEVLRPKRSRKGGTP